MSKSDFNTLFAETSAPAVLAHNGRTVTYTVSGQNGIDIQGIDNLEQFGREDFEDGEAFPKTGVVSILNDAFEGIVSPVLTDTLTIDGVAWAVTDIDPAQPGGLHRLTVARHDRQELSDGGSRMIRG